MLFAVRNSLLIIKKHCPHMRTKSLTRLHKTIDEKNKWNRPIILTSLIVYVDDIILKKKCVKFFYDLVSLTFNL